MQFFLVRYFFLLFFLAASLASCGHRKKLPSFHVPQNQDNTKQDIVLEVVRQSSNLLECTEIIGNSIKKLDEENEILIQIGVVDTNSDVTPRKAAVIKVKNKEIFLYQHKDINFKKVKTSIYEGEGYKLTLSYENYQDENYHAIFSQVNCIIETKTLKSQYQLKGMPNGGNY